MLFAQMCHACDAPDVLAEALNRSNELGLLLSHNRVHEVLMAWGAMMELHKIEQVRLGHRHACTSVPAL